MNNFKFLILIAFGLYSISSHAQVIDRSKVLFGLEATFQDQGMVDEPGRMTFRTKHKEEKFNKMIKAVKENFGVPNAPMTPINHEGSKPGFNISLPIGPVIADMEPVCIEWNQLPLKVDQIAAAWTPFYKAAEQAGLVPYVNPAAERSGMGHIHIGGETVADSPFFKHPTLLRNMMVYVQQHPSLLWGFSEAYDLGPKSNIETHHLARQAGFNKAVQEFDFWYEKANSKQRIDGGLDS